MGGLRALAPGPLGRAGVAVLTREQPSAIRTETGLGGIDGLGRWIEVDLATALGPVTVVSAYVHTGEAGTPRQEEKFRFLDAMDRRLATLRRRASRSQGHVLVTGDFNIAQSEMDIKNWRPNRDKAGFLPEERAYLDRWFGTLGGNPGPWHDQLLSSAPDAQPGAARSRKRLDQHDRVSGPP